MVKLKRLIKKALEEHHGWWLIGCSKRGTHYIVTNGKRKLSCSSSPKSNQTVIKNLHKDISRIERGIR